MPIFDLADAKPLFPKSRSKRTLGPSSAPWAFGAGGNGNGSGFSAAKVNRLTQDFLANNTSADQDLFGDNKALRARSRKLALDNPFVRKFLQMVKQNVVGEAGILIKSTVTGVNGKATAVTENINKRIDEEWRRWCRQGRCTADGKFSFAAYQGLAIVNAAREGENLVKFVYGRQFNECGFALQPLDNDQLDDSMMQQLENGGEVRMGVEVDQYRKPQAYWLFGGHPSDLLGSRRERKRISAEYICHSAVWERPGQTRGYTWMAASILALNQYAR